MSVDYPQFGVIERLSCRDDRVKRVASELRVLANQTRHDRFDPFAFAKDIGIGVQTSILPVGCSGRLSKDKGYALIELNQAERPERQRFTLCHELAHVCFWSGGQILKERAYVGVVSTLSSNKYALEEQLCDQIASELLMPTKAFQRMARKEVPSFSGVERLARHFDVSRAVVMGRIRYSKSHGWIAGSVTWDQNGIGPVTRNKNIQINGCQPRRLIDRSRAMDIACSTFGRAEEIFRRTPYVLTSLESKYVSLAMPSPEATIWRDGSAHQRVHGVIFFRL